MNNIKCDIHNKFEFEVIDGKSGKIREKATAYNIVTNKLWNYLITTTTPFATYIQYGSGSGTPSASDTSLFNRAGGVAVTEVSLDCDYENKVITRVCKIILGLNDAVGVTLREVGMAAGSADGTLTTHAMLQDMNGNPISIAKTDTDIINIYSTIYCHWTAMNSNISFHPAVGLKRSLTGLTNIFGSFTCGLTFSNYVMNHNDIEQPVSWSKTNGNISDKTITYTASRYGQSSGNIGGIEWILGSGNYDGVGIKKGASSWSKYTIENETLGTGDGEKTKFKTKFSFPYNATVKVNGVAQISGVSVLSESIYPSCYFEALELFSTENNKIYNSSYNNSERKGFILYNPFYTKYGITQFRVYHETWSETCGMTIDGSNDMQNWERLYSQRGISEFNYYPPADKQNFKYYKVTDLAYHGQAFWVYWSKSDYNNVIFDTPPAVGDVISITYDTDCIPKDSDHVLDASITFQFGEYNE